MYEKELSKITSEHDAVLLEAQTLLKICKIVASEITVSNEEIDELIKFGVEHEKYSLCEVLKRLKK